jgi:hypothetical protein
MTLAHASFRLRGSLVARRRAHGGEERRRMPGRVAFLLPALEVGAR